MHNVNQSFCVIAAQQEKKKKVKVLENRVQTVPRLQLSRKRVRLYESHYLFRYANKLGFCYCPPKCSDSDEFDPKNSWLKHQ